jgi:hypothetical protein
VYQALPRATNHRVAGSIAREMVSGLIVPHKSENAHFLLTGVAIVLGDWRAVCVGENRSFILYTGELKL